MFEYKVSIDKWNPQLGLFEIIDIHVCRVDIVILSKTVFFVTVAMVSAMVFDWMKIPIAIKYINTNVIGIGARSVAYHNFLYKKAVY